MDIIREKVFEPTRVLSHMRFKAIFTGPETSFAVAEDDSLYGWGRNDSGQIGVPSQLRIRQPTKIIQSRGTVVSAGSKHTFAYNRASSKVFCWGCNESGQLGLDKSQIIKPTALKLFQQAKELNFDLQKIVCGEDHTLAILVDSGQETNLFSWGSNRFWQLAIDTQEDITYPYKTDFVENLVDIAAKNNYSMAVTKAGKVFSWGSGQFGRLGYQTLTKQERRPRLISQLENIGKVVLGTFHAIAIGKEGRVFSWGRGTNGQLGLGNLNNQSNPKLISALSQLKIVDAGAGEFHSVFLSRTGELHVTGGGSFGQLGLGERINRVLLPTKISLQPIQALSTGSRHNLILTYSGQLRGWGHNEYCQVGKENRYNDSVYLQQPSLREDLPGLAERVKQLQEQVKSLKSSLVQEKKIRHFLLRLLEHNHSEMGKGINSLLREM